MDDEIQINIILEKDTELNKEKIVDDKINIFKDLMHYAKKESFNINPQGLFKIVIL